MPGDMAPGRRGQEQYGRDGGGQASLAIVRSLKPCIAAINGPAVRPAVCLPFMLMLINMKLTGLVRNVQTCWPSLSEQSLSGS